MDGRKGVRKPEPGQTQHEQYGAELGGRVKEQREERKICTRSEVAVLKSMSL